MALRESMCSCDDGAEVGEICLQATKCHGLPVDTTVEEAPHMHARMGICTHRAAYNRFIFSVPRWHTFYHLQFATSGSTPVRVQFCCFKHLDLCSFVVVALGN